MSKQSAEAYEASVQMVGWILIGFCALMVLWCIVELWTHRSKGDD